MEKLQQLLSEVIGYEKEYQTKIMNVVQEVEKRLKLDVTNVFHFTFGLSVILTFCLIVLIIDRIILHDLIEKILHLIG